MSLDGIISHLASRNCKDVTGDIDLSSCSQIAISTGGFGDVYRGALRDGTLVALKCLRVLIGSDDEGQKQFKRAAHELYVWSKCNHPNVLKLIGVAKYRNQIAMVSPWMNNGNLSRFLAQNPKVDRYRICVQITDGLAYLHSQGIVYGDMKGANILMSQDHTPKLTDFGSAMMKEYTLQFTATQSQSSMSLRWTAPEVVMGETEHTSKGDVYALGMTMLEVITGLPPYTDVRLEQAVMYRIMSKTLPERPKELIPSLNPFRANMLWSLLASCWQHDPLARPTTMEVQRLLKAIAPEGFKHPHETWYGMPQFGLGVGMPIGMGTPPVMHPMMHSTMNPMMNPMMGPGPMMGTEMYYAQHQHAMAATQAYQLAMMSFSRTTTDSNIVNPGTRETSS
ncbi:hypothetical protein CTheo_3350 [Ceratobasidium theobromae]|uniref:Protein kinase domain-containing protein n=1 Tax=Ceratobasidium theobromae TaxID=1582974 RepID=A0A5N5QPK7_9AGAM|nr:hypothetical protein CTheo_3350 [Ceratobasidium theobromae]